MAAKTPYAKMFAVAFIAFALGYVALGYVLPMTGVQLMAAVQPTATGAVTGVQASQYLLDTYTFTVLDELNQNSGFGDNDVYAKLYPAGEFDWDGAALDTSTNYTGSTGKISFTGKAAKTSSSYDVLFYQGDGGTNLYAKLVEGVTIPDFTDSPGAWAETDPVFMLKEGAFKETALDNMEGNGTGVVVTAWDESNDVVTLDKSDTTVEGTIKWDFSVGNTVSGSCIKNPVIVFYESESDQFTDIDDIEHIYLSVKSGSGISVPSRDLVDDFKNGNPIEITSDGCLGSGDSATLTLQIDLPSSEADVGTGTLVMSLDDLGDKNARDLDKDKRASAESVSIKIQA